MAVPVKPLLLMATTLAVVTSAPLEKRQMPPDWMPFPIWWEPPEPNRLYGEKTLENYKRPLSWEEPNLIFGDYYGGAKDVSCGPGTKACPIPGSSPRAMICVPQPVYYTAAVQTASYHKAVDYAPRQTNRNLLEVHTLPIGQGDCTVIYCPNGDDAVLFDCGSTSGGDNRFTTESVSQFFNNVQRITIIVSHGDQDHYNYLPRVFQKGPLLDKVTKVIFGGSETDLSCARSGIIEWRKLLHSEGKEVISTGPKNPYLGDKNLCNDYNVHFDFIAAGSSGSKNERSIVMRLSRDASPSSLLFSGDMEGKVAENLATNEAAKLQSTHYKIAHHGASTKANSIEWLTAVSPMEAHVSHAYIGQYGHPRCEAINRLMNVGSIGVETSHTFTCVKSRKPVVVDQADICHRLFSTSPTDSTMCVIKLVFVLSQPAVTHYYCDEVAKWHAPPEEEDIGLCPEEED